jgi:DNA-binding PadR family transcriptional regulator
MERLHKKGFISDPVGKAKSVILTEKGQREAERLFAEMFAIALAGTRDAESATPKLP